MRQADRLRTIFDELDNNVQFQHLLLALREGFVDEQLELAVYTDHQLFERYYRAQETRKFSKKKALTLRELKTLQPGDYVTHQDYGIARFAGLTQVEINGQVQEAIRLVYRDDDLLTVSIHSLHKIAKYSGAEGAPPTMSKLGSPEWENKKKSVKKKVKDIAADLIRLYAKRKTAPGFAFSPDGFMQAELESSFIYEDTPDQAKATEDVKQDMQQPHPMDRLVCGDVGFRQDRSGHSGGLQGRGRWQAGGRAGAHHHPGHAALQDVSGPPGDPAGDGGIHQPLQIDEAD